VMKWGGRGWGYGYVRGESGFCGITPELLFQTDGRTLRTMALAGTAKPGADAAFLTDVKEIDEHELVVRYIENQLKGLGLVRREGRGLLETAGLRHFHTPIEVALKREVAAEELISLLHPTPAVGCMPRSEEWLLKLQEYRSQLAVPGFFGAPFGYCSGGGEMTMVVSIRGVGWAGGEVSLPSGCGIVAGSAFDHEWRELRLKRESVMNMLRL
jgi:menaquinone-specific isochorismate synthase